MVGLRHTFGEKKKPMAAVAPAPAPAPRPIAQKKPEPAPAPAEPAPIARNYIVVLIGTAQISQMKLS